MTKPSRLEEELFAAALALPATERESYLQRACDGDPSLHARVISLLDAFEDGTSFIKERPRVTQLESTGDQIGGYRLLHEIGEGGCGVVYLAEQTAPVKRQVALKVIKLGMDTKAVIARFEAERQALALMDHPNIAKVFDAGATPTGRPYFVMELVRGIKIAEYCDQTHLRIPERLALFIQVCQAIQHAHHKGIIHRDIKPSNVLVTLHDGVPVAKVIDFGIAKATQGRLADQTLYTALEQFVGTPAYVSPEQIQLDGIEADTRSDIYSLGVLLYELLTGCTPFDATELMQAGLDGMRQRIREEEPPSPSKRLSTLTDELIIRTSARYQTTITKLVKQIHGDLDWIVMRCLEKERSRRYQTANDLWLDLQRYLHHEPVAARPRSVIYTFRKFARRHRLVFATGTTIIAVLLIATAVSIWQAVRATQAERLAQEVIDSLQNIFSAADPFTSQGTEITARELLEHAGRTVRDDLSQHPEVRSRLLESIGRIYRRRGDIDRSISYLEDAVQIRKQMPNAGGPATLTAMTELAVARRHAGDLEGSDKLLKAAIALARQLGQERTAVYARLLANRGRVELDFGNIETARKYFEDSLALNREVLGPRDKEVALVLLGLSRLFQLTDDLQAAERTARDAVGIYEATVPPLYPDRVLAEARLGEALQFQNRFDEAALLFEKSLKSQRLLFGDNSTEVADILDSLAKIRRAQGLLTEAEDFARRAVQTSESALGAEHYTTAYLRNSLAALLVRRGKYGEAEAEVRRALDIYSRRLPPDHPYVASSEYILGEVLLETNRLTDAEAVLTASMNRWERAKAPKWRSARSASALGEVMHRQGRAREAERYLADSYRTLATDKGADREALVKARERVARFYRVAVNAKSSKN